MRIALDAMGGDHAPQPNIDGCLTALRADPDLEVFLVGDRQVLDSLIEQSGLLGRTAEDHSVRRRGRHGGEAHGRPPQKAQFLDRRLLETDGRARKSMPWSARATPGRWSRRDLRTRLFLKNVKRPGIAVALPTAKGRSVLVDVGANPAARPEHLYQYGVMGSIYARDVLGIENPRIGLMNIGSEEGKGNELYRETHRVLTESRLKDRYIGNVEGRGLYQGEADVLVCEGFVGNVVLKVSEGMAEFMMRSISAEVLSKLGSEREAAGQAFRKSAAAINTAKPAVPRCWESTAFARSATVPRTRSRSPTP